MFKHDYDYEFIGVYFLSTLANRLPCFSYSIDEFG